MTATTPSCKPPTYRLLFDHPQQDRFTAEQFLAELDRIGLVVGNAISPAAGVGTCPASPNTDTDRRQSNLAFPQG